MYSIGTTCFVNLHFLHLLRYFHKFEWLYDSVLRVLSLSHFRHVVVIRPRTIHRTPQRFNITEEILPYNNVCNLKIKHTNSKFCRLCIIYKIPELIKDNYFPKIVLEKMYTHSYSGVTKYAKIYTIRKYKAIM